MAKRILIIDDEAAIRAVFSAALNEIGYTVETAASGTEALAKVQPQPPDLIFLDLRMPGMDGIEVLRRLQTSEGCCAQVPVYIVTAFRKDYFDELSRALADGLRFNIADKPLTIEQIQSIARGVLEASVEG